MRQSNPVNPNRSYRGSRASSDGHADRISRQLDAAADLSRRGLSSEEIADAAAIAKLMREERIGADEAAKRLGLN